MTSVKNVAQYILKRLGTIDAKKLEKLCYFSQGWSLTWGFNKLFPERIEAWAGGPVIPVLFDRHRGQYSVSDVGGDAGEVERDLRSVSVIDSVIARYGAMSGDALADLTHMEDPWLNARRGLSRGHRSNAEITDAAMIEYYGRIWREQLERTQSNALG